MHETKLLIDGDLVVGEGAEEAIIDPATGGTIARVHEAGPAQIDRAVRAAETAFASWGSPNGSSSRERLTPSSSR